MDIPAPLKALLPDYQRMETYIDGLIRFKFGIKLEQATVVKYADLTMLATERRDLEIDDGSKWEILEGIPCSDLVQVIPLRLAKPMACSRIALTNWWSCANAPHEGKRTRSGGFCLRC